eukprot:TRINITY_DN2474_c0_g1_i14.p3 TRINITY_DN2474_c0_g1~~TRINITY_DN2474_c0_g1_i14.p3  ORF type:complete len:315 (-),score=53.41 TRINITY_DN2474_c0_g1_i14:4409-5353(-)
MDGEGPYDGMEGGDFDDDEQFDDDEGMEPRDMRDPRNRFMRHRMHPGMQQRGSVRDGQMPRQPSAEELVQNMMKDIRSRARLQAKIERLNRNGAKIVYDDNMTNEQLMLILEKHQCEQMADHVVSVLKRLIIFGAAIFEYIDRYFPSLQLDLKDWSSYVFMQINEFEDALYNVYDEYEDKFKMSAIGGLFVTFFSKMMMYSMSRKMTKETVKMTQRQMHEFTPRPETKAPDTTQRDLSKGLDVGPDDDVDELLSQLRAEHMNENKEQKEEAKTEKKTTRPVAGKKVPVPPAPTAPPTVMKISLSDLANADKDKK